MREVLDKQVIEALTFPSFKFIMLHAILSTALFEWILITGAVDFLGLGFVLMHFHTSPVFLVRVMNNIHIHIVKIVCWLKSKYMRVYKNKPLPWIRLFVSSKSSVNEKYNMSVFTFQQSKLKVAILPLWCFEQEVPGIGVNDIKIESVQPIWPSAIIWSNVWGENYNQIKSIIFLRICTLMHDRDISICSRKRVHSCIVGINDNKKIW